MNKKDWENWENYEYFIYYSQKCDDILSDRNMNIFEFDGYLSLTLLEYLILISHHLIEFSFLDGNPCFQFEVHLYMTMNGKPVQICCCLQNHVARLKHILCKLISVHSTYIFPRKRNL